MSTRVDELSQAAFSRLQARVDDAYTDTQVLLCHGLGVNRAWLLAHPEDELRHEQVEAVDALVERRRNGEPVAYITGEREFWQHRFAVTPDTLIPRPETEHLIEAVLEQFVHEKTLTVLDFGTGSGAIAISLALACPTWQIVAIDTSEPALAIARNNAQSLGAEQISFNDGNQLSDVGNRLFDVIVSNPPYVAEDDPHLEQGDVRFEPRQALVSGKDGLDCIRTLIQDAPGFLNPNGLLILEHGYQQGDAVRELFRSQGYQAIETRCDLAGNERLTMATFHHG